MPDPGAAGNGTPFCRQCGRLVKISKVLARQSRAGIRHAVEVRQCPNAMCFSNRSVPPGSDGP